MKRSFFALLLLALAACGGGGVTPTPVPIPTPAPAPVETQLFALDLSQSSISIAVGCNGAVGNVCPPLSTTYGTFGWGGAQNCVLPAPNSCYSITAGQSLNFNTTGIGAPIITTQTFPLTGTLIWRAKIAATCAAADCWGGLVPYNGDAVTPPGTDLTTGDWTSLYFSLYTASPREIDQVMVWGPSASHVLAAQTFFAGTPIDLEIDYVVATQTWTFKINGTAVWTTPPVPGIAPALLNPPTAAIFGGDIVLTIYSWAVSMLP